MHERSPTDDEERLVRAFVVPARRDRLIAFLANPKKRRRATERLAHFRDLDPRWATPVDPGEDDPASVARRLTELGAGHDGHIVSENPAIDGKRLPLEEALAHVVGHGYGTLISLIPGELAYFEGEGPNDRFILHRPAR